MCCNHPTMYRHRVCVCMSVNRSPFLCSEASNITYANNCCFHRAPRAKCTCTSKRSRGTTPPPKREQASARLCVVCMFTLALPAHFLLVVLHLINSSHSVVSGTIVTTDSRRRRCRAGRTPKGCNLRMQECAPLLANATLFILCEHRTHTSTIGRSVPSTHILWKTRHN